MKLNKKKTFTLAMVIIMLAILSFATLAWFNDSAEVTNKFYVASSDTDGDGTDDDNDDDGKIDSDDIFSVNVIEEVDTDGDGVVDTVVDTSKDDEEHGTTIKNILPGEQITKKPEVKNTGKYDQWIRITLTFADADDWKHVSVSPMSLLDLDPNWVAYSSDAFVYNEEDNTYTYVYYQNKVLTAGQTAPTFTTVSIPTELTQEDMFEIDTLTLKVKAEAVQVDNIPAENAKAAFDYVGWAARTEGPTK